MSLTLEQALANLARVADAHLLNGPDRRIIEQSIALLDQLVKAQAKAPQPPAPSSS